MEESASQGGIPTLKQRKYDRQLRLWSETGQTALENAHILLVNSPKVGAVAGVEALKNLVLPGIGHFTIVDEAVVTEVDLGNNFFLEESCLGRSRGESCAKLLLDLNEDVHGDWYPKTPEWRSADHEPGQKRARRDSLPLTEDGLAELLAHASPPITHILYTLPLRAALPRQLRSFGSEHGIPVLELHSAGFYAYFHIHYPGPHPVVDTHPDEEATMDLRLLSPWPELTAFAEKHTHNLEEQSDMDHGHIPYVALLLHFLQRWREDHDGAYPRTYQEKAAFQAFLHQHMRTDTPEAGEENMEEAVAAVTRAVKTYVLPEGLRAVFAFRKELASMASPLLTTSSFWVTAAAVERFYQDRGELPVSGRVPDMKATSEVYMELQTLYKEKARRDAQAVLDLVRALPGGERVAADEVTLFCRNAAFVRLVHGRTHSPNLQEIADQEFANDTMAIPGVVPLSLLPIYLSLRACAEDTPASAAELISRIPTSLPATATERVELICQEVVRGNGHELHNVSAVLGGMAAQEIIKLVTRQYIPMDNVCVFDGIVSRCQVFAL